MILLFPQVWSELARPNIGAVNFFTGMGGFLQTLIFGYASISIHLDKLMIEKPGLPPGSTRFKIQGKEDNTPPDIKFVKYVDEKVSGFCYLLEDTIYGYQSS